MSTAALAGYLKGEVKDVAGSGYSGYGLQPGVIWVTSSANCWTNLPSTLIKGSEVHELVAKNGWNA